MKSESIIKLIKKRIAELKKIRNTLDANGTRTKYNFVIGELQNFLLEIKR